MTSRDSTTQSEMNQAPRWLARIPLAQAPALAPYRLLTCLEGTILQDTLWLRSETEAFPEELYSVGGLEWFDVSVNGPQLLLHPPGKTVPTALAPPTLSEVEWLALFEILVPTPPKEILSGSISPRALVLVDSIDFSEPNVLMLRGDEFISWATTAAEIRLRPLKFCKTESNKILIWGTPLPPLQGARWNEFSGIAVPAGKIWEPRVPADLLRHILGGTAGSLTLLHGDETMEVIHEECWLPATRTNLRACAHASMLL